MSRGISGPDGIKDNIQYRGVSFKYNEKEDYVLKDVNLTIKKGEVVAVVGASGGGKTTLVNLLPRFYEVQEGAILIDGQDTKGFQLKTLRQNIAVVTQDTILFNDTIRNNIAYGKEEFTQEMVAAAARAAHADIFIEKFPKKYNTIDRREGVPALRRREAEDFDSARHLEEQPDTHPGRGHIEPRYRVGEDRPAGP